MKDGTTNLRLMSMAGRAVVIVATLLQAIPLYGQTFTLVTEGVIAMEGRNNFGAAWVDVDDDDDLDLYVANAASSLPNFLYLNNGDGTFTKVEDGIILTDEGVAAIGTCWADYDNDGDLDVYNAGQPNSFLYRNDGNVVFTKITDGDIGGATDNRGWSCAWGDYDNDGFVDLFVAHPAGFVGEPSLSNSLFRNNGDGTFERITDTPIVQGLAPYTVGNWTDYDDDGDLDLFIGSGPATTPPSQGPDYLYRNLLAETGAATFERITEVPLANDRDGQTWNFIDYDNDGDLDGFVTNYSGYANELYENDGEGTFIQVTEGPLVTDQAPSLANVWGDFDNDGDLDVFIANEAGSTNIYYRNERMETGTATFSRTAIFSGTTTGNYGAAAGDFDNDGDLDLFVASHSGGGHKLYRNETNNGNHWLKLKLVGTTSNRAGIGAKVTATAMIGGESVTLRREVSTQNTFNGHNSLLVHLGLGDAETVQELRIEWSSGTVDVHEDVAADQFLVATEGMGASPVANAPGEELPDGFHLAQNYPNPFNPATTITYGLAETAFVRLRIYDVRGRHVATLVEGVQPAGGYAVSWEAPASFSSGAYLYRLETDAFSQTKVLYLLK